MRHVVLCLLVLGACASPRVAPAGGPGPDGAGFGFDPTDAGAGERPGVGGAGGQSCAYQSFAAERLPLDLVVLVDASGSMADPVAGVGQTKWQMAQEALFSFVRDPGSAGLGLGLQFFPAAGPGTPCAAAGDCGASPGGACGQRQLCLARGRPPIGDAIACAPGTACPSGTACQSLGACAVTGSPCSDLGGPCPGGVAGDTCRAEPTTCLVTTPSCSPDRYAQLAAPISDLPSGAPALVRLLGMRRAGGFTPMSEAVVGTLMHLRARATAMPRRRTALVLATDGLPSGCSERDIPLVGDAIWTARNTAPSVPTYVIGVLDAADLTGGKAALAELARAGGSGEPFILTPASDLTGRLLAALAQIRGDALPCEYTIPQGTGAIDFDRVNVAWKTAGAAENFPYVASAQRCDPARGGWYYDVEPGAGTPTRVILCPASCNRLKSDATAQVELRFGCKTVVIE